MERIDIGTLKKTAGTFSCGGVRHLKNLSIQCINGIAEIWTNLGLVRKEMEVRKPARL